jgi:hypothetical protein
MLHMDIGTVNAIIAARQEQVATMLRESRRPGPVTIGLGSLLIRIGRWLAQGQVSGDAPAPVLPVKKHPQLA